MKYSSKAWKHGKLVTITKAPDKDPVDPKLLKPVTLLSELGKLFKRTILQVIFEQIPEIILFTTVSTASETAGHQWPVNTKAITYADDIAISIKGNSRKETEDTAKKCPLVSLCLAKQTSDLKNQNKIHDIYKNVKE